EGSSCASTTAQSPTWRLNSLNCATQKSRLLPDFLALRCVALPPSRTAIASAPPTSGLVTSAPRAPRPVASEARAHHAKQDVPSRRIRVNDVYRAPRARRARHLRIRLGRPRRGRRLGAPWSRRRGRPRHFGEEERAGVDAGPAPEGAAAVHQEAVADVGC